MNYLIQIFYFHGDGGPPDAQGSLLCSHPESSVDEWLEESGLPRLHMWKQVGQAGSHAPSRRGVLNSVHYALPRSEKKLVLDAYSLSPVDPLKERIL